MTLPLERIRVGSDTMCFYTGGEPMLEISPDGFWVRGCKVAQDDTEAEQVYTSFKTWLAWSLLQKEN